MERMVEGVGVNAAGSGLVTLCLDLLPSTVDDDDLRRLLGDVPGVCDARIVMNARGQSLGFAIVHMATWPTAEKFIAICDGAEIHGSSVRVSRLFVPTWRQAS